MTRAVLLACVFFLGCDRADELIAAAVVEALAEPQRHSAHAADCAEGKARMGGRNIQLTVDCRRGDGGAR
jgi:hypothetical protein